MINKWFYIIPSIFFGYLIILAIRKIQKNNNSYGKNYLPLFIISLYFLSALLIYFISPTIWYPTFHESSYTAINFTIYSFFLFLFLLPSLYLKPITKTTLIPRNRLTLHLMLLLSFLGLYSLIYQIPYAIMALSIGAVDIRNQISIEKVFILPDSPFTTLAVGISTFYIFYIAFFFIAIVQKRHLIVRISLLIASLSYIVSGLIFTGRDAVIFYTFSFLFVFLYFRNLLAKTTIKKLNKLYIFLLVMLVFFLSLISLQRFNDQSDYSLAYGTIGYIAQQPFVFSETIEIQNKFYEGHLRFPVFVSMFTPLKEIVRTDPYEWSFGTFIKDFYSEGGYLFLISMTLLFVPLFFVKIRSCNKNSFYRNLIIVLFYFQFMSSGVFYFKLGSRSGNIYMIVLLIFYFLTYFGHEKKRRYLYGCK